MRIKDFEKAIDAMNLGIVIDEMKIRGGRVMMCYGHVGSTLLMWDEYGDAYGTEWDIEEDGEIDHDTHDRVSDVCYFRRPCFDF